MIDDDAWLGFGVIVLDGYALASAVLAQAVVTQDVPDAPLFKPFISPALPVAP